MDALNDVMFEARLYTWLENQFKQSGLRLVAKAQTIQAPASLDDIGKGLTAAPIKSEKPTLTAGDIEANTADFSAAVQADVDRRVAVAGAIAGAAVAAATGGGPAVIIAAIAPLVPQVATLVMGE